jgi:Fe-S-cluster containining protein
MEQASSYNFKVKPGTIGFVIHRQDGTCPYLKDGGCSVYPLRPKVCRDYGIVPDLPCEYLYPELARIKQEERMSKAKMGG